MVKPPTNPREANFGACMNSNSSPILVSFASLQSHFCLGHVHFLNIANLHFVRVSLQLHSCKERNQYPRTVTKIPVPFDTGVGFV
jgi:hypothetical protein